MKHIIYSLLRQLIFWMLLFATARSIFIIYHFSFFKIEHADTREIFQVFYYALKLDLATACYFLLIPFFILAVQSFWSPKFLNLINKIYTAILVIIYALITSGEIGLYGEWKTKINVKALVYLKHPDEVFNSADTNTFFILLFITLALSVVSIYAYHKFFYLNIIKPAVSKIVAFTFLLIMPLFLLLGLRGGFQEIPINQSQSYFSQKNILNLTATNNAFNLLYSLIKNSESMSSNPFAFYTNEEARKTVSKILETPKDTTIRVIENNHPNIVLLIMESWSADLIESLGGEPGITPQFHELEKEGILFTKMLSSGSRSEQGMASIFGGFPAHPLTAITLQPDKFVHLPSLIQSIRPKGYHTAFYFGGQLIYGNIKGFILHNGFDRVMEGKDFADSIPRGKLGVHDEFTMSQVLHDLNREQEPFFTALFTLSSHSPYDQPMEDVFEWGDNERQYINAAFYTDKCLGEFIAAAKKEPWYDNTLFVIVADHSHNSYRNWPYHTIEYHSIPMLWYGNAIKPEFRGIKWAHPGSQVDMSATLLAQMDIPAEKFMWSRNLFNPYSPKYNYFGFDNGVIWREPEGSFSFDCDLDAFYWKEPDGGYSFKDALNNPYWQNPAPKLNDSIIKRGKSYLQVVFQEYLDY